MTQRTNARIAGVLFLLYIATGVLSMMLFGMATRACPGAAAQLAGIARHEFVVRLTSLLSVLMGLYALGLGATLYALTRDVDRDLALMGLCSRAAEGVVGVVAAVRTLGLVSVATMAADAAADPASAKVATAFGEMLLKQGGSTATVAAACFAVGSTIFSYLFLRARAIPKALAVLGVAASAVLLLSLPSQITGIVRGPVTYVVWIPMAVFEVTLALWLIFKGTASPATAPRPAGACGSPTTQHAFGG